MRLTNISERSYLIHHPFQEEEPREHHELRMWFEDVPEGHFFQDLLLHIEHYMIEERLIGNANIGSASYNNEYFVFTFNYPEDAIWLRDNFRELMLLYKLRWNPPEYTL